MAKVETKHMFEKPNFKFEDSPLEDRVFLLEKKFARLTLWTSLLTFLLVATVIGAVIVQILLNGNASTEDNSPNAALVRHTQRSLNGNTHEDMEHATCCHDLAQQLTSLELRLEKALNQLNEHSIKIIDHTPPLFAPPQSDVAHKHPGEGFVPPEISSVTFVETGNEYDYPDDLYETGSGDDHIFIDSEYDYDSREIEVAGSGMGPGTSDDEDLPGEGSGCRAFARPVCSDGCVTDIIQDGCPVPICCKALPEPDNDAPSSGHHHHHH